MKYLILLITLVLVSCTQRIAINTDPSGVRVYLDGDYIGLSPLIGEFLKDSSQIRIRCEKEGYGMQERVLTSETSVGYGAGLTNTYNFSTGGMSTGFGSMVSVSKRWPADIFIKLEKLPEKTQETPEKKQPLATDLRASDPEIKNKEK